MTSAAMWWVMSAGVPVFFRWGRYTSKGMLFCGGLFRFLLTIVLAVTVPFCCCNFHALMSTCAGCERSADIFSADIFTVLGAASFDHEHADGSHHHHDAKPGQVDGKLATTSSDQSPSPCGPGHKDEGDCTCGKHDTKMLTAVKSSVEFSTPVLVAVLAWPAIAPLTLDFPTRVQSRRDWAHNRPPTSLLRLHCALVV